MSRRRKPTFYGALNEAAVALLDRQHRVWPREVVAYARNLHAELFELERERLVMQAAERIAKQVMKDLTEDDDDGRSPTACQLVLLGLALPLPGPGSRGRQPEALSSASFGDACRRVDAASRGAAGDRSICRRLTDFSAANEDSAESTSNDATDWA